MQRLLKYGVIILNDESGKMWEDPDVVNFIVGLLLPA